MKIRLIPLYLAIGVCAVQAWSAPQAKWLSTSHNFGAFSEDMGNVTTTFHVVNTGDEPLMILAARANCGCTTPKYSRTPIAPGDTAAVTVGFNPAGRIGKFEKYILVDTNSPAEEGSTSSENARSRQQLTIRGTVIGTANTIAGRYPAGTGALRLRSATAAFGTVAKGKLASVSIAGYNHSSDSITIQPKRLPAYITATIRPEKVAPGEMFNILLNMNTRDCQQWGIVTDSVCVMSDAAAGECRIKTVGIITEDFSKLTDEDRAKAPNIELSTDMIDFGRLTTTDNSMTQTVEITNTGKSTLRLRRIYTTDPSLSISPTAADVKPGKSVEVKITVSPSSLRPPMLNARVSIICNVPGKAQTSIRVAGEVK